MGLAEGRGVLEVGILTFGNANFRIKKFLAGILFKEIRGNRNLLDG